MHDDGEAARLKEHFLFSNNDPLGIKNITLGGDAPSLQVEARIAVKQWAIQNGSSDQGKVSE